jgi:polysaccharide biosynthesis protein PslG
MARIHGALRPVLRRSSAIFADIIIVAVPTVAPVVSASAAQNACAWSRGRVSDAPMPRSGGRFAFTCRIGPQGSEYRSWLLWHSLVEKRLPALPSSLSRAVWSQRLARTPCVVRSAAPDLIRGAGLCPGYTLEHCRMWLFPRVRISFIGQIVCIASLAVLVLGHPQGAGAEERSVAGAASDTRDDLSPWGVASGAEWFSAYPIFNPILKQAGVRWLRGFYEWQSIQPKQGYWNFALPDRLVEDARANGIHLSGAFAYFAPWASADGGTRRFPIKNIQFWRDYVTGMVGRYRSDIKYWEVWNEFNGSFAENGTPEIYAELVREASVAAKKIDPAAKIGMSVANFDIGFLDAAIKAGAANHFDFICVHPYEKLNALSNDGEQAFLGMAATLRQMLTSNHQPADMPLWITEIGSEAPIVRDDQKDQVQAKLLAKAYLLAIASGFQRVFWFEARGPSYGNQSDLGLIRADMTPRPSYQALKSMTEILGPEPLALGWLKLGDGGFGFLFNAQGNYVLAAWAPKDSNIDIAFSGVVRVSDLSSGPHTQATGEKLHLTDAPQLIMDLPDGLVQEARSNKLKPYAWGGNSVLSNVATARLQTANIEVGLKQIRLDTTKSDGEWRRTDISMPGGEGHYVYLLADPQFVPFGARHLQITATVRRMSPDKEAGFSYNYESQKGYVNSSYFNIPADDKWHEITLEIADANFVGAWGWNFRLNAISSLNDFLVKEVKLKK